MLDTPLLRHHKRFLAAAAAGGLVWLAAALLFAGMPAEIRLLLAGDTFFAVYLGLMIALMAGATPESLRDRARTEDEGIGLIAGLTLVAVAFSLGTILTLLNADGAWNRFGFALALISVPLGWLALHTMAAQHYGRLFYGPRPDGTDAGGLDFPGEALPVAWDFLYFSFVIGMTAQVSDVEISAPGIRRVALLHSLASFVFNTVIVAVAVNAAVSGPH